MRKATLKWALWHYANIHTGGYMTQAVFNAKAPGIMRLLMADFELTVEEAAAIMGNLGHESGGLTAFQELAPTVAGSRGGWGWAQWTGPRRRSFEAYCARNGLDPKSDKANYGWLFVELKGPESKAIPALKSAVGLRNKVIAFENAFERAGIKHYDSRVKWAERALAAYAAQPVEVPMPTPIPTPTLPVPTPKPWYLSKGVIGGLIAALSPLIVRVFPAMGAVDPNTAADSILQVIDVAGPLFGGLLAILGRVSAIRPVAGTQAEVTTREALAERVVHEAWAERPPELPTVTPTVTNLMDVPLSTLVEQLPRVMEALTAVAQATNAVRQTSVPTKE